jgi:hypothetical protein
MRKAIAGPTLVSPWDVGAMRKAVEKRSSMHARQKVNAGCLVAESRVEQGGRSIPRVLTAQLAIVRFARLQVFSRLVRAGSFRC